MIHELQLSLALFSQFQEDLITKVNLLTKLPNNKTPFAGDLNPVNSSGRKAGRITISCNAVFAASNPAISSHLSLMYNPYKTFGFSTKT